MAIAYPTGGTMVAHTMVTTQFELDGFRVVRTLGVVRGIVVRSRSIIGTFGATLQTLVGGNAVVGARYDATEIMQGVTEVLAYGTAVLVEPTKSESSNQA